MAGMDLAKIRARLESIPEGFAERVAQVGWFPSAKYDDTDATPVAYVATIQEHGAPAQGIPARPFIKPTVEEKKAAWVQLMGQGVKQVVAGNASAEDVLEGVGLQAAGDIRAALARVSSPALSPTTVLLRKWRREGRTITGATVGEAAAAVKADPSLIAGVNADPLNDTGLMQSTLTNSIGPPG